MSHPLLRGDTDVLCSTVLWGWLWGQGVRLRRYRWWGRQNPQEVSDGGNGVPGSHGGDESSLFTSVLSNTISWGPQPWHRGQRLLWIKAVTDGGVGRRNEWRGVSTSELPLFLLLEFIWGRTHSIVGRVVALYAADTGSIPATYRVPCALPGLLPEHSWVWNPSN